ncbi:MAG: tRNA-guanine transglycosylase [Alistipes communis]
MGVGTPANLLEGIERGVDMFDCVMPTRNGRNGHAVHYGGHRQYPQREVEGRLSPIDPGATCFVDTAYTKAYLRHLTVAGEMMAAQIAQPAQPFVLSVARARAHRHILDGTFSSWKPGAVERFSRRL